ncbi:MAG: TetR/AcrR family transcriptional regulator [Solirubrobacteraceae bacterium]
MPTQTKIGAAVKPSPRERLLKAATELFYAEGVQSVGIDRVIERAGVAKASLYSTFGSKEELVRAYLEGRHEVIMGRLRAAIDAAGDDPVERILAVFDSQAELYRAPTFRGCAFAMASAEAPAGGRIDLATESYRGDVRGLFAELAAQAGVRNPEVLASQLQMIYDGASLSVRMDRDPGVAVAQRAAAAALVQAARAS